MALGETGLHCTAHRIWPTGSCLYKINQLRRLVLNKIFVLAILNQDKRENHPSSSADVDMTSNYEVAELRRGFVLATVCGPQRPAILGIRRDQVSYSRFDHRYVHYTLLRHSE